MLKLVVFLVGLTCVLAGNLAADSADAKDVAKQTAEMMQDKLSDSNLVTVKEIKDAEKDDKGNIKLVSIVGETKCAKDVKDASSCKEFTEKIQKCKTHSELWKGANFVDSVECTSKMD